jgi:hypothetical protein
MDTPDKLSGPPSKDQFARLMMDAIHKAGETGEITCEQAEFRLRGEGENTSMVFASMSAPSLFSKGKRIRLSWYDLGMLGAAIGIPWL